MGNTFTYFKKKKPGTERVLVGTRLMVRTGTAQQRATAASLRVSWFLAKKKRPFTDSDTVNDCMLFHVNDVINNDKIRTTVTSAIKNVPLSDTYIII